MHAHMHDNGMKPIMLSINICVLFINWDSVAMRFGNPFVAIQ